MEHSGFFLQVILIYPGSAEPCVQRGRNKKHSSMVPEEAFSCTVTAKWRLNRPDAQLLFTVWS